MFSSCHALRTHHSFPLSLLSRHRRFPEPFRFSAIASNLTQTLTLTLDPSRPLNYGPSLQRGRRPLAPAYLSPDSDEGSIEWASFSRAFDIAALRVPAEECAALERRLRGHLLNWPRVRNVARVSGDDIEPDLKKLLRDAEGDGGDRLRSLARRPDGGSDGEGDALSPVMYREKLAKEFNCRGFLKFRNLAKISRPKKKKKKGREGEREESEVKERVGKNDFTAIEVVSSAGEEEEDLRGLLGDDFQGGRWRGPTRLLLLDERYANKGMEELPEAVKVALMVLLFCKVMLGKAGHQYFSLCSAG